MGFPRLPRDKQLNLAPTLLEAIENKPPQHQDGFVFNLIIAKVFYLKHIIAQLNSAKSLKHK